MRTIRIGHSPDPDDAYMFYAITHGLVGLDGPEDASPKEVLEDIQSLNRRALTGELEMTAISAAVYPQVADRYRILACGASMGLNYGPIVIAARPMAIDDLRAKRIGMPGVNTTAFLLSRIMLPEFEPVQLPFDQMMEPVRSGEIDAAVVINEGQLTFGDEGVEKILDLGELWHEETGLPLPLGLDCVRRDLGDAWQVALGRALQRSIDAAYANNEASRGVRADVWTRHRRQTGRKFAKMYVNELTVDMGTEGESGLRELYTRAHAAGLLDAVPRGRHRSTLTPPRNAGRLTTGRPML